MSSETKKQEIQHKNWVFTMFYGGTYADDKSPQPNEEEAMARIAELAGTLADYVIVGKEVTPTTGQKHLQGYCQLATRARRSQLAKIMPRTHLEPAAGDDQQNYDYCSKEGKFTEFGDRKTINGGKREKQRWEVTRKAAVAGDLDAVPDQIFVQHYSSIRAIMKDFMQVPEGLSKPTGVWIHGEAGVGKSFKARELYPEAYLKQCNKWWDGYRGQPYVIIDDLDKGHACLAHYLKIWMDEYAFSGEIKGGAISLRPAVICVTSQYAIEDIWQDQETIDAIRRRCKVTHMGEPFKKLTTAKTQTTNGLPIFVPPEGTGNIVVDLTAPSTPEQLPQQTSKSGSGSSSSTMFLCENAQKLSAPGAPKKLPNSPGSRILSLRENNVQPVTPTVTPLLKHLKVTREQTPAIPRIQRLTTEELTDERKQKIARFLQLQKELEEEEEPENIPNEFSDL